MLLTVDANGNDATSPDFDRDNVVQWGFHHQFNDDARAIGTFFGPGIVRRRRRHGADPRELDRGVAVVQRPDRRRRGAEPVADRLRRARGGQRLQHGQRGDGLTHLWYTCCVRDEDGNGTRVLGPRRGAGVQRRRRRRSCTPTRSASCRRRRIPEAAFEVLTYLLDDAAPVLLDTYGGLPAREDLREPFFAGLDELFPQGVNWQAALAGLERPDVPSHESQHAQLRRGRGRDRRVGGPPHDRAGPRRGRGRRGAAGSRSTRCSPAPRHRPFRAPNPPVANRPAPNRPTEPATTSG